MKKNFLAWVLLCGVVASVYGQSAKDGPGTMIITNLQLTNVYVFSQAQSIKSYDSFAVTVLPITNQPNGYYKFKHQFSSDNANWFDEVVMVAGTSSGTEQPYTFFSRVINGSLTNGALPYIERFRRLDKWYRIGIASTNVTTTGTVSVVILEMNNGN